MIQHFKKITVYNRHLMKARGYNGWNIVYNNRDVFSSLNWRHVIMIISHLKNSFISSWHWYSFYSFLFFSPPPHIILDSIFSLISAGIYWFGYERIKAHMILQNHSADLQVHQTIMAGAMAGSVSQIYFLWLLNWKEKICNAKITYTNNIWNFVSFLKYIRIRILVENVDSQLNLNLNAFGFKNWTVFVRISPKKCYCCHTLIPSIQFSCFYHARNVSASL